MNIRVTGQTQTANAIAYQRLQFAALAKYQDQISSGLRVKLPSDDPSQFPALTHAKAAMLRFTMYSQTIADATTDLNASVNALQEVNNILVRAKEIAIEGANSTTEPRGGYEALAKEVDSLIDRALRAANAQQDGKYLFAGTATTTRPFLIAATDSNGRPTVISYQGTTDRSRVLISPGETVQVRYAGNQVFQSTGTDVFQALIGLRDDLRAAAVPGANMGQAISTRLGQIDAARTAIGESIGEQSASLAILDTLQSRIADLKLDATIRAVEIEGTDYAEAMVKLQSQDTALQATLAISARLLQPSLLDFLR
jgi:flagellar hook-associated protein 3 FlgL